ncbi:MAG: SDR family oxidoreductase [Deltaproteobacteria bacterium]|nr:SDR family oxidoreductase [Deltaproteobacteria bacterium]
MKKAIFITGAASGIGRATALRFARDGWFVGLFDIDEPGLEALHESIGKERACHHRLDVTDPESIGQAMAFFAERTDGRIDVLFNCAGILRTGVFEEMSLETHGQVIDVNARGVLSCCHVALPYLKASDDPCVVNACSASALHGVPGFACYSATKFFVRGLTEALNIEWQRHGIRVVDVLPSFVDTPMARDNHHPMMDRQGVEVSPEQVAEVVARAARGSGPHYLVGAKVKALSAVLGWLPGRPGRELFKLLSGY